MGAVDKKRKCKFKLLSNQFNSDINAKIYIYNRTSPKISIPKHICTALRFGLRAPVGGSPKSVENIVQFEKLYDK